MRAQFIYSSNRARAGARRVNPSDVLNVKDRITVKGPELMRGKNTSWLEAGFGSSQGGWSHRGARGDVINKTVYVKNAENKSMNISL